VKKTEGIGETEVSPTPSDVIRKPARRGAIALR